jgi:hypothetical protein
MTNNELTTGFRNLTRQEATNCLTKALGIIKENKNLWCQHHWHSTYSESENLYRVAIPDSTTGYCGTSHCLAGWGQIVARDEYGIPVEDLYSPEYAEFFALSYEEAHIFDGENTLEDLEEHVKGLQERPEINYHFDLTFGDMTGYSEDDPITGGYW